MIACALFLLLYLLAEVGAAAACSAASTNTRKVQALMVLARARQATPQQLRAGAVTALSLGYRQTATAMLLRAEFAENVALTARLVGADPDPAPSVGAASPWPDVGDAAWRSYLRSLYLEPEDRSDRGGAFGLTPRLLAKLGIMTDVRRGEDGEWEGRWTGILPQEVFLNSLPAQVQAIAGISVLHRGEVGGILSSMVGQDIEGRPATRSGLLAVALRAGGRRGLESWLQRPADRDKFVRTTEAFYRSNGIF